MHLMLILLVLLVLLLVPTSTFNLPPSPKPSTLLSSGFGKPSSLPPTLKISVDSKTTKFLKSLPPQKSTSLATIKPQNYRGIVALKNIKKGDPIIAIPYTSAIDLGTETVDPLPPALKLKEMIESGEIDKSYVDVLPSIDSEDYKNVYSCWSEEERLSLGFEFLETEANLLKARLPADDVLYYIFLITSRVLTVQNGEGEGKKLLIPYLDMCNHDEDSVHVLTGVAAEGKSLKVIAGKDVKAGEEITIKYGSGSEGVDDFLRDYGFDPCSKSCYKIFAQKVQKEIKMGLKNKGGLREEERRQIRESLKGEGGGDRGERVRREVGKCLDEIDGW